MSYVLKHERRIRKKKTKQKKKILGQNNENSESKLMRQIGARVRLYVCFKMKKKIPQKNSAKFLLRNHNGQHK